jgi:hypothetical protein
MTISAIIIYGGDFDKKLLEKAKKSVAWCDEVILINGVKGSFNDWRDEGLKKAKSDWVLYLDSDEEISTDLKDEIEEVIFYAPKSAAFAIPRRNFIFNKEFKYSGQYPDYQKRLFRKKYLKKWTGDVHEEPVFEGNLGYLKNPITHHKNMTLSQMVSKTNKWSEIEAKLMFEANHPQMNIFRFFSAALREFWLRFVVQVAFLDGKEGIIYSIYQIYSRLISYSKLWEMQLKNKK